MLSLARKQIVALRNPLNASSTLSFVSLGDAFLYPFLPQYATSMSIPVVWVGVLLSINRFVRIVINPFVSHLFAKYGFRRMTIAAAVGAIISTTGYGLGLGLASLVFFRTLWGITFSILRMSTLAYASQHKNIGVSLGTTKSIQELGPMFALVAGPFLLSLSEGNVFYMLACLSVPGLFYATKLPELYYTRSGVTSRGASPSANDLMTFLTTFTVEGLLVVTVGFLLSKSLPDLPPLGVITLAGGYLAYRRISIILFSPALGVIADRLGIAKTFRISLLCICAGLVLLVTGWTEIALVIIFTFQSVSNALGPANSLMKRKDKMSALASNTTWRDIGAATGVLAGGMLSDKGVLTEVLIIITFVLVIFIIIDSKKKTT